MLKRQTHGSVVCPSCGRLVGVQDAECFGCGRKNPGLWGFAPALKAVMGEFSFSTIVMYGCLGVYLISCVMNLGAVTQSSGLFSLFSPGTPELWVLGASGSMPMFAEGRWWTPLSATWLHGGLLHILLNLYWLRGLAGAVEQLFGFGRTAIIYVLSGVAGFVGTSVMFFLPMPGFLQGAGITVGASASMCGLLGALYAYGRAHRDFQMQQSIKMTGIFILVFGFLFPMVDNWAHIFGFLGGVGVGLALRPRDGEAAGHLVAGLFLVLLSALALVVSVLTGLDAYNAYLTQG